MSLSITAHTDSTRATAMITSIRGICEAFIDAGWVTIGNHIFDANNLLPDTPTDSRAEVELRALCNAYTGTPIAFGSAVFEANEYLDDIDRNLVEIS